MMMQLIILVVVAFVAYCVGLWRGKMAFVKSLPSKDREPLAFPGTDPNVTREISVELDKRPFTGIGDA